MKIKFQAILTAELALEAVKQDGHALRYVKDQTEAVALEAVKQDGYALQFVLSFDLFVIIANKLSIEISE